MKHAKDNSQLPFVPRPVALSHSENTRRHQSANKNTFDTTRLMKALQEDPVGLLGSQSAANNHATITDPVMDNHIAIKHPSSSTLTPEQGNILQAIFRHGRACDAHEANYHTLVCGHTVLTSASWPCAGSPKSRCASNCTPSLASRSGTLVPFTCSMCLETNIRRNYISVWKEYRSAGRYPDPDAHMNVSLWVYASVSWLKSLGLRVTQGTSGIFLLHHFFSNPHIDFVPSLVMKEFASWDFRSRSHFRGRSLSPVREKMIDSSRNRNRSNIRGDSYRNGRSAPCENSSIAINELAEHFTDTSVGLRKDNEVDNLLREVEGLPLGSNVWLRQD